MNKYSIESFVGFVNRFQFIDEMALLHRPGKRT